MAPVQAQTTKQLGALLLRGWAMLAENCPDCQVPLMRERGAAEMLCVNCDAAYVADGQGLRPAAASAAPCEAVHQPQPPAPAKAGRSPAGASSRGASTPGESCVGGQAARGTGARTEEEGDDDGSSYDPRSDPRLGPFALGAGPAAASPAPPEEGAAASDSAAAGSGSAAGPPAAPWPTSVGPPLTTNGGRSAAALPAAAGAAAAAAGAEAGGGGAGGAAAPPPAHASTCPPDDVADLLSTKMLQGWALLDRYCPRCSTVLVRARTTRRMFCVACDAWVLSEEEQQQQQQQALASAAGESQPLAQPSPQPSQGGSGAALQGKPTPTVRTAPLSAAAASERPATAAAAHTGNGGIDTAEPYGHRAGSPPEQGHPSDAALLASIRNTLASKMAETQALLQHTAAADVERVRAYVSLLADCVDLLAKTRALGL